MQTITTMSQAIEAFEESIDDAFPVSVAGHTFRASRVLRLDRAAWHLAWDEYLTYDLMVDEDSLEQDAELPA